jgi:hypothetical protein
MTLTAYVTGEQKGLVAEKPFLMGETLREGTHLDIDSELNLIKDTRVELNTKSSSEKAERTTMKELGLKRSDTKKNEIAIKCTCLNLSATSSNTTNLTLLN